MEPNRCKSRICSMVAILSLSLLALNIIGCVPRGIQVVPVPSRDVMTLSADDIVQIMQRAGFSNDQIIESGTDVRAGLAKSGGVYIFVRGKVEAIFAINGEDVYISTLSRGYFIYNVKTGWVTSREE